MVVMESVEALWSRYNRRRKKYIQGLVLRGEDSYKRPVTAGDQPGKVEIWGNGVREDRCVGVFLAGPPTDPEEDA